jgi:Tfp pilus assembly protein FimT
VHSFQLARTEAIRAQKNVVVCASNNPGTLAASCSDGAFTGWIVFADSDGTWQRESSEPLIQSHDTMQNGLTVRSDGTGIRSYNASGFANLAAAGKTNTTKIVICDSRGNVNQGGFSRGGRVVMIDATGHARADNTYAAVTAAGGCP